MKNSEVLANVMAGTPCVVGKYWSGSVSQITFRDKKTNQAKTANIARETVLTSKEPMAITRFLRDDEKPEAWHPSAKKMEDVFVRIEGMNVDRGSVTLQGTVEVISG